MKIAKPILICLLALAGLFFATRRRNRLAPDVALAAKTYIGSDGIWETASNWDPAGVPTISDAVTITKSGAKVLIADKSRLSRSLCSIKSASKQSIGVALVDDCAATTPSACSIAATQGPSTASSRSLRASSGMRCCSSSC